jgi:hypothetical protein
MHASHWDMIKPKGVMKVKVRLARTQGGWVVLCGPPRTPGDPKDGGLCLVRTKSGETLMEVRSDSDVQIDRRNWV